MSRVLVWVALRIGLNAGVGTVKDRAQCRGQGRARARTGAEDIYSVKARVRGTLFLAKAFHCKRMLHGSQLKGVRVRVRVRVSCTDRS